MNTAHQKIAANHLSRDAYLYVRQSSLRQVFDHGESTRRQYALRERAVALGWPTESIVVIDSDLGLSGADVDREGFRRLVAEVGMGRAGIVLGLEVSRLARKFHRLASIARDLRRERDADPRRGWRLRSHRLQRQAPARPQGDYVGGGAAHDARPAARRSAERGQARGV